jgi:transposase
LRQVLADIRTQLVPVLTAMRSVAAIDPVASTLDRISGFGPVFSVTVRAEIGTITRFPDGPHLASYAGLVPRVERSGQRRWSGRITKCGSPWLRWVLVEAAIHQFRRQDDFGRWARRLAVKSGILKTRVAVARALCSEVFMAWPRV